MENTNFIHETNNYDDFNAADFFGFYGYRSLAFKKKVVKVGDAQVILTNVRGYNPEDKGHFMDIDLWPNTGATEQDIKALPEDLDGVIIRFGKYVDDTTGEEISSDTPKIAGYLVNGKWVKLHGRKPQWDEENNRSVWSNEPAE